jgi:glycosyltransferase involved in cell wall biosynthesis
MDVKRVGRPKISIGIPVYNAADHLAQTLDSVLMQSFADLEIVISDNASSDATPEIARSYSDRDARVRYEANDVNIGIAGNFNRAYRLSRGEYFKWQAHDDLLEPQFLMRCAEILDADASTVAVGTRVRLIEEDGSPIAFNEAKGRFITSYGEEIPPSPSVDRLASADRFERFRSVLFDVAGPVHTQFVFALFRSDALGRTRLVEPYIGGEKVMLGRLSLMGRLREVPGELFLRRYHPSHAGRNDERTWRGFVRMSRSIEPEQRLVLAPLARQIAGYVRAILDADLSGSERLRCAGLLASKVSSVGRRRVTQTADKTAALVWRSRSVETTSRDQR